MYILKGEKSFSILNINGEDMAMLFDGFNSYRLQLQEYQKMSSKDFQQAFNVNAKKEKMFRELFSQRVKNLADHIGKIQKMNE